MKKGIAVFILLFLPVYLSVLLFTKFSFVGYWTDTIFIGLLSLGSIFLLPRTHLPEILKSTLIAFNFLWTVAWILFICFVMITPFSWNIIKTRSFKYLSVNDRIFNGYFKPVGSYGGGYGVFWITETPKYFPIIEWEVHHDNSVDHDFAHDTFEGEPIDNAEVVKRWVQIEVIEVND